MKRFEIFFGIVKIPVDFLMTSLAFLLAYKVRLITKPTDVIIKSIDLSIWPTINEYLQFSFMAAVVLIIIFILGKMYLLRTTTKFSQESKKIFILGFIWGMAMITYFFFTRTFPFSRLALIYSWGLTLIFILIGRALIRIIQIGFLKMGLGRRKIVFVGYNKITKELFETISSNASYKVVGVVSKSCISKDLKFLDTVSNFEKVIKKHKIDEVIQTKSDYSETQNEDILELCDLYHIHYRFVPDLIEVRRTNIEIDTIGSLPIISLKATPLDGWGKVAKRSMDFIGALLGMILLSPVFLITAIAIKIDSRGPVFFSKLDNGKPVKRVGQKGKLFNCYKFRSMKPNTHNLRYTKLAEKNIKSGPIMKIEDDPRVTRVGKFIRKYSIDELPQIFNVLIGNMSLVGPRPHLPEEVADYKNHHRFVLTIKPGLSGPGQISDQESKLNFEKEVKLNRYYIENWSIWLDIKIIFRTISFIFKGENH
ncbi:sugar transferase [Patescibacteria group bacterium]